MKITFLGGGNMATALASGMLKRGFAPSDIAIAEMLAEQRERLTRDLCVAVFSTVSAAVPGSDLIVLAVKPQQLREVVHELVQTAAPAGAGSLMLSIAAGIRLTDIARWLGRPDARLVRAMPNTPALIGMGVTAAFAAASVTATDRALIERVLAAVGKHVWVDAEPLLDPVTAVSGSGPAYVFYFLEAMQEAAVAMGLPRATGELLALETFRGAAELACRSDESPKTLRERVTSRGGTTAAALASMDRDAVKAAIVRALAAANTRAAELATEFGRD